MGAEQSSSRGAQPQDAAPVKACYYEVLNIDRNATDDEVKKAYRKKALELHPDRNYGNVEVATAQFAEVSTAYEVLSDPQERAWYDSHRESILRGDNGVADEHFEHNVRQTSASDIVRLISKFNSKVPFTDEPDGFYRILQTAFSTLAAEERAACDWEGIEIVKYPDFGRSEDDYEEVVRPFYRTWTSFSTNKTFWWREQYRPADAQDRATRRLIEKENRRLREEGIKEFNDAVISLVLFVRKRDPRYIANSQTDAERAKILRGAAAAQAARSRAANQARLNEHIVPQWAQTETPADLSESSESTLLEVEHIECVVCSKTFKSERQYEAHEKSKKHVKAVQQLQREMRKENKRLNLDTPSDTRPATPLQELEKLNLKAEHDHEGAVSHATPLEQEGEAEDKEGRNDEAIPEANPNPQEIPKQALHKLPESSASSDMDDEYASREDVENRLLRSYNGKQATDFINGADTPTTAASNASDDDLTSQPKFGKAKAKRAKRAAKQEMAAQENQEFKCAACQQPFPSKTKLFSHIKEEGHAQPVPKATNGKNKTH